MASKANRRIGTTKAFRVYGAVRGTTIRSTNPNVDAAFIDPTIDAGVIPLCPQYTLDKRVLNRGERSTVTVTARLNGKALVGRSVTITGLGIS